ncbi:uncharacterized protein LOC132642215 [Lycium barbarum]|uniref:uncharacterized protein LOC132642215 n=1 Tax=Lycium barbarum TaxID=112863 RepID=UPI00293EB2C2|nr:uncharacterized protein LOC132642215 [Lycium barbarum]
MVAAPFFLILLMKALLAKKIKINNDPSRMFATSGLTDNRQSTPQNIHGSTLQIMNGGRSIFSRTYMDENRTVQENEWIQHFTQPLLVAPPPMYAPMMVDQRQVFEISSSPNVGSGPINGEASTSYEQAPCQCYYCRLSTSRSRQ